MRAVLCHALLGQRAWRMASARRVASPVYQRRSQFGLECALGAERLVAGTTLQIGSRVVLQAQDAARCQPPRRLALPLRLTSAVN